MFDVWSIAWISVVIVQAYIHFIALPRQRKRLEEDRLMEEEIRKNMEQIGVCNAATYQRSSYSSKEAGTSLANSCIDNEDNNGIIVDSHDVTVTSFASSLHRSLPLVITPVAQNPLGADGLPDPGEDEDLEPIDDGEEESRLKLLKYYYSPSTPDIYSQEPFRSSCGSISSLEEDPDPRLRIGRTCSIVQPTLQTVPPASNGPSNNGVLKRRDNNNHSKSKKDTFIRQRHVGFSNVSSPVEAAPTLSIHSAPAVQCV